jgi:coenzyme PQQ precursor peptide PqqA
MPGGQATSREGERGGLDTGAPPCPNSMQRNLLIRGTRRETMAWKKPRVTEVCLALEINCYASATV